MRRIPFVPLFCLALVFCQPAIAKKPLRVAVLPIPDALPFHVAEAEGYFRDAGIAAEPVFVASALERDQLMQAGRIDAMINEMATTAGFNRDTIRLRVVRSARKPMGKSPLFRFLVRPGSPAKTVSDLAGLPVAVSRHTVIEYVTDRILQNAGVPEKKIVKRSVPVIPERFQLLIQGRLDAAVLPDPLATSAIKFGAVEIINDLTAPFYSVSVLSFREECLKKDPAAIQAFAAAWDKAAAALNGDPDRFRAVFEQKVKMPPNIKTTFPVPPFPVAEVPTKEQWQDVVEWMQQNRLLKKAIPYADGVMPVRGGDPAP